MNRTLAVALFLAALLSALPSIAQESRRKGDTKQSSEDVTGSAESETESSVAALAKADTSNTTDYNLDVNLELKKGSRLLFGFESTQSPDTATSPGLNTKEYRLGLGGEFGEDFLYTLNYAYWGQPGIINTNTLGLELKWLGDNFISSVTPQVRFIYLDVPPDSALRRLEGAAAPPFVTISDPSINASLNYIGLGLWHFKVTGSYYHYSRAISNLAAPSAIRFFSSSSLTQANNFNEWDASAEIGYSFGFMSVSAEDFFAVSAVDFSSTSTYTLKLLFFPFETLDIEVDGGQTPAVGLNMEVNFATLGLTYYF